MATMRSVRTAEEIAAQAGSNIPFLRLPERASAFSERARRLRTLAPGHAMQGYLELIATLAEAQQAQLDDMPPVRLPDTQTLERAREHGMPPLDHHTHARDLIWTDVLRRILRRVEASGEGPVGGIVARLEGERDELYEAQASKLLAGVSFGLDAATAPFIAAGLQVYFAHLAIALGEGAFAPLEVAGLCPCCGAHPTASVVRIGGAEEGYRFLHCSLCGTEWHMVRIKCAHCEATKGISQFGLEGVEVAQAAPSPPAVLAETCDECGHYLKIGYMERDAGIEPCADDLATVALDILVAEQGREPTGVNFMLIHGDPEGASP
jgi:FdhE protein